jgi:hypothetical protein
MKLIVTVIKSSPSSSPSDSTRSAATGKIGDDKVWVIPAESVVRMRTGVGVWMPSDGPDAKSFISPFEHGEEQESI